MSGNLNNLTDKQYSVMAEAQEGKSKLWKDCLLAFLFGGLICGFIVEPSKKKTLKSFLSGILSALPTLLLILMASSIRYILEEGKILATVANSISHAVNGKSPIVVILMIYLIILLQVIITL